MFVLMSSSNCSLRPIRKCAVAERRQSSVLKIRSLWTRYRAALCLTQEEAAELTGYDRSTVGCWEQRNGAMVAADALWTLHELYLAQQDGKAATG